MQSLPAGRSWPGQSRSAAPDTGRNRAARRVPQGPRSSARSRRPWQAAAPGRRAYPEYPAAPCAEHRWRQCRLRSAQGGAPAFWAHRRSHRTCSCGRR